MENGKYTVNRDNIYVGKVVRTDRIYRHEGNAVFFHSKFGQLETGNWLSYRSMLFVPNEKKFSNDLLYQSPSYPILNITDDETCLNLGEKSVVIKEACNLALLLEYFGYDKILNFEDILRIRKNFFNGKFAMDNCELFGYKETKPEDLTYYKNGIEITDPRELKGVITQERKSQQAGHRSFTGVSEGILPREYWDVLNEMGDNDFMHAIEWHEKINAFAPHKQEGPIKKLAKI